MKLQLPRLLAAAVLAAFVAAPAYTAEILDNYETPVTVYYAGQLSAYSMASEIDYYAFLLGTDIKVDSTIQMEGGNLLFTSSNEMFPASLEFAGSDSTALSRQKSLVFDTLSHLSFAVYSEGAIRYAENLSVQNVNDGVDNPENPDVFFLGDSAATCSSGGAIYASGYDGEVDVTFMGNGDVTFTGNATSSDSRSEGGAIYASASSDRVDVIFMGNGDVTFSGNSSSSLRSSGGAIYVNGVDGGVSIRGNGDVSFMGNASTSFIDSYRYTYSFGGAIYADSVDISGNGDVTFTGNVSSAYAHSSDAYSAGGAIYAGDVTISGNESVCFEKNYEKENFTYRLRSVYSSGALNLSAKTGGHITVYDSVYGDATSLNADYTDSDGKTQLAKGDIIFSGLYTKTHLDAILEENGEGRVATDAEILNSCTSTLGDTMLYGGTLQVVDGAVLDTTSLTVAGNSDARVLLRDAGLNGAITLGTGSGLELQGTNTSTGTWAFGDGAALTVTLDNNHLQAAALTLSGGVSTGALLLNLHLDEAQGAGMYRILSVGSVAMEDAWTAENVSVQGSGAAAEATFDDLLWLNGTLYYYASGTGLKVDNNTHLVLEGSSNSVAGAVEVAAGSTLVMKSSGYVATSSMVNGTLAFADTDASTETLSGSGSVQAVDSQVTVEKISGFTGDLQVTGKNASLSIGSGNYTGSGTLSVVGSTLTFGANGNITLNSGGQLVLESWADAVASVSATSITVNQGAVLAARAGVSELGEIPEISRRELLVDLNCSSLTLNVGSALAVEDACFDLNNGVLILAVQMGSTERIELVLAERAVYTGSEQIVLFKNAGMAVFAYDRVNASNETKTLSAANYFIGAGINETTQLVYDHEGGTVYLQGLVMIPEPATATLGLLALAGLCARRRRT